MDADRPDLTSSSPGVSVGREYSFPCEAREKRQPSIDVCTEKGLGVQMERRNRAPPDGAEGGDWEGKLHRDGADLTR